MLLAKDCDHLTADDWAGIVQKILKAKKEEHFLVAISDEHEGGVTSCMADAKAAIQGFAKHADTLLLNGDDFEYESPAAFLSRMTEFKEKYAHLPIKEYRAALHEEAEAVLHQKVKDDIASLEALITENPKRNIVKVIGNHENFDTFRDALTALAKKHDNFTWAPELAIIRMPGSNKGECDRLLATHGDLQMDDLWFVEEGGTDKERKCLTHEEMADKVVGIATRSWAPSAQKQEKGQAVVNWWRKPNATAKTVYAELLFRAQEGDYHKAMHKTELDMEAIDTAEYKLKKRKKKFKEFAEELKEREDMTPERRQAEALVYERAVETIDSRLEDIKERRAQLEHKSEVLHPAKMQSPTRILHYQTPNGKEPKLFTAKTLGKITHINYGHTHVSAEEVQIKGQGNKPFTVSNNASVTGAIMQRTLDEQGKPVKRPKGQEALTELGNMGMLIYRIEDGKITDIKTAGHIIAENIHMVKQLIRDIPKPERELDQDGADEHRSAIDPQAIIRKRANERRDNDHDLP